MVVVSYHLMTEKSDLDTAILVDRPYETTNEDTLIKKLKSVRKTIEEMNMPKEDFQIVTQVLSKRIPPRLQVRFRQETDIDITFHIRSKFINFLKERDQKVIEMTKDILNHKFLLLVKLWAQRNYICNSKPPNPALNSYGWIMVGIFYLKNMEKAKRPFRSTTEHFLNFVRFGCEYFSSNPDVKNHRNFSLDPDTGEYVKRQWRRSLMGCVVDVIDPVEIPKPDCAERNISHACSPLGRERILHCFQKTLRTILDGAVNHGIIKNVFKENSPLQTFNIKKDPKRRFTIR